MCGRPQRTKKTQVETAPRATRQMTVAQKDDYWIFGVQDVRRVRSKSSAMPKKFSRVGITPKVPGRDLIFIGGDSFCITKENDEV